MKRRPGIPLGDKQMVRAVGARLRLDPHFRDWLTSLIEDNPTPALQLRIQELEDQVRWLISVSDQERSHPVRAPDQTPMKARSPPRTGSLG